MLLDPSAPTHPRSRRALRRRLAPLPAFLDRTAERCGDRDRQHADAARTARAQFYRSTRAGARDGARARRRVSSRRTGRSSFRFPPAARVVAPCSVPPPNAARSRSPARAGRSAGRRTGLQLARFCAVGLSGFVVNLGVYALLVRGAGLHYLLAATLSFLVAVTSNYTWNRLWTFRQQRGHVGYQGLRFFVVSTVALGANLSSCTCSSELGVGKLVGPGGRDRARHPAELRGKQALVVRALAALADRARRSRARRQPRAATGRAGLRRSGPARRGAVRAARRSGSADGAAGADLLFALPGRRWLERYPPNPQTDAEYRPVTGDWLVKAWSGQAGQIVLGKVDDRSGAVTEAWTGPQVAWTMARGGAGRLRRQDDQSARGSGSRSARSSSSGSPTCRRPLSLRNLDLLALLSFSISLRLFNEGEIFWSAPLAYPPLVYLLARCVWIARDATGLRASHGRSGRSGCSRRPRSSWSAFACGLNLEAKRSVIDVGFAGVVGAHRIANGRDAVRRTCPSRSTSSHAGRPSRREIRERIQTNGRCEAANARGDTYGPISYFAYLPGYAVFGWSGSGTSSGPRMRPRCSSTALCRSGSRSSDAASAAPGSQRRSHSPGPRIPSRSTRRTRTRTTRSCPPS